MRRHDCLNGLHVTWSDGNGVGMDTMVSTKSNICTVDKTRTTKNIHNRGRTSDNDECRSGTQERGPHEDNK